MDEQMRDDVTEEDGTDRLDFALAEFEVGPYDEIYPLPLVAGLDPEEAMAQWKADSLALGSRLEVPTRGRSRDGMYAAAMVIAHNKRLREAMAGGLADLPEAVALREEVLERRRPMSLRPLGLEHLEYTFAPVLQYLGGGRWQVGIQQHGGKEVTFEEADPARAVERAQIVVKDWVKAEETGWIDQVVQKVLPRYGRSLFHEYWAYRLQQDGEWDRGGGFGLVALRHSQAELHTPNGARLITMERVRAVHVCDALARHFKVDPDFPSSPEVLLWLTQVGVPFPSMQDERHWTVGNVQVELQPEAGRIVLVAGGKTYLLVVEKRQGWQEMVLHPANKQGKPDTSRTLAHTVWEPPLPDWLRDAGRMVVTAWAAYAGKLVVVDASRAGGDGDDDGEAD